MPQPGQHPVPAIGDEREQAAPASRGGQSLHGAFKLGGGAVVALKIHPRVTVDLDVHQRRQQHGQARGTLGERFESGDFAIRARQPHGPARAEINGVPD